MAKKHQKSFARVDNELWRKFKVTCIQRGQKICEAQTEAIKLYLNKKEESK